MGVASPPFAHLHVASSHSLRYGATLPELLVQRSAELGQSIVALTDRDGLYAAVRWVRECSRLGIRPVLGVDIAVEATQAARVHPDVQARTPSRGGRWIDETRPRVRFLAPGSRVMASRGLLESAAHIVRGH